MAKQCYPYVCIECGVREEKNRRFFPLDALMRIFRVATTAGNNVQECLRYALPGFQVGALFGAAVLDVKVPVRQDSAQVQVWYEEGKLAPVPLTMTAVLGAMEKQLKLKKGALAALVLAVPDTGSFGTWLQEAEHAEILDASERQLLLYYWALEQALMPWLEAGLGNADIRRNQCVGFVDMLRLLVEADPAVQIDAAAQKLVSHPETARTVYAVWTYTTDPGSQVQMPAGLRIFDPDNNQAYQCAEGCCPYCHRPLPRRFGACRQVTVGVLGGQSAGKTTYLAALTDSLSQDASMNRMPFSISRGDDTDPQWKRFRAEPKTAESGAQESAGGPLWLYRNGYRVRKTELTKADAASLTFLVQPENGETVLFVLADIAGEAFTGDRDMTARQVAEQQKALLKNCDALFMVYSCDPDDQNVDAADYVSWMEGFTREELIGAGVPAALLLTKVDRIFAGTDPAEDGGVRAQLAYALRYQAKTPPVVDERYNVEAMGALCRLTMTCADNMAPGLTGGLRSMLRKAAGGSEDRIGLAAFPVCSGTGAYAEIGAAADDADARRARYAAARRTRSGVQSPLLWLLALANILPAGRGNNHFLEYDDKTNALLAEPFRRELCCPGAAL